MDIVDKETQEGHIVVGGGGWVRFVLGGEVPWFGWRAQPWNKWFSDCKTKPILFIFSCFRLNKSWASEGKWFASLQVLHRDYKKYNTWGCVERTSSCRLFQTLQKHLRPCFCSSCNIKGSPPKLDIVGDPKSSHQAMHCEKENGAMSTLQGGH